MADEGEMPQQAGGDDSAAQPGDAWGDPISEKRQAKLRDLFERQKAWMAQQEASRGESVFKGVRLTGADVYWLAEASGRDMFGAVPNLHLEEAALGGVHLARAYLSGAHLERASLTMAQLKGAHLSGAHLEGASLIEAHLEGALLIGAHLEGAFLGGARLEGADLTLAQLKGTALSSVKFDSRTNLISSVTFDSQTNLISSVTFDSQTNLRGIVLSDTPHWYSALAQHTSHTRVYGPASLADVHWNDVDLSVVDWSGLRRLGDERSRRWWWRSREESMRATRANIQLAKRLRDAGLSDDADRFAYRAQVCQRGVHLLRLQFGRWLFSWLLFILAGYGYQPLRTLFWYLTVIFVFAAIYSSVGPSAGVPLSPLGSLVFSITSFHGRGFFPGGSPGHSVTLDDPLTVMAAMEAIVGLFIEISFIATFTQRYFGR